MASERRTVVAVRHSSAPIDAVWARLSQARTWKEWAWFPMSDLEREGDPAPDGVGAIRRFGLPFVGSREEVVAFDPPRHLGYRLLSGLPVKDYRSDVTLTPTPDGGTSIEWRSSFVAPWRRGARFWEIFLRVMITDFARRLARAAPATS